jgi:hypothetical protein
MNAQLKPLDVFAVSRPAYDNLNAATFFLWSRDNDAALRSYYADLGRSMPDDEDNNLEAFAKAQRFICFCKVQWDRERGAFV